MSAIGTLIEKALNRIAYFGPNLLNRGLASTVAILGAITAGIGIQENLTTRIEKHLGDVRSKRNEQHEKVYQNIIKNEAKLAAAKEQAVKERVQEEQVQNAIKQTEIKETNISRQKAAQFTTVTQREQQNELQRINQGTSHKLAQEDITARQGLIKDQAAHHQTMAKEVTGLGKIAKDAKVMAQGHSAAVQSTTQQMAELNTATKAVIDAHKKFDDILHQHDKMQTQATVDKNTQQVVYDAAIEAIKAEGALDARITQETKALETEIKLMEKETTSDIGIQTKRTDAEIGDIARRFDLANQLHEKRSQLDNLLELQGTRSEQRERTNALITERFGAGLAEAAHQARLTIAEGGNPEDAIKPLVDALAQNPPILSPAEPTIQVDTVGDEEELGKGILRGP